MLQGEVFILELVSIDALSTSAIAAGEIAALAHEVRNDTMELAVLVAEPLLTSAQSAEILYKPKQIFYISALNLTISQSYVSIKLVNQTLRYD